MFINKILKLFLAAVSIFEIPFQLLFLSLFITTRWGFTPSCSAAERLFFALRLNLYGPIGIGTLNVAESPESLLRLLGISTHKMQPH